MRSILYLVFILRFYRADSNMSHSMKYKNVVESCCDCSVYDRSVQRILNRNKRWFVFPKGANVLMTMVVTKTIIDGKPRGLQESLEMEMAVSVPPWVEGWRPITPLENIDKVKSGDIKITAPKTKQSSTGAQSKIDKIGDLGHFRDWKIHKNKNFIRGKPTTIYGQQYINQTTPLHHEYTAISPNPLVPNRVNTKHQTQPWQYHREYRERRQIFQKLEGLEKYLEVSIKSCIMRAICEVKHGLLPEGESFIHDVARILFTIPLDHEIEDDYVNVARDEESNCAKKFSITCPFNPIEHFLQSRLRPPIR